MTWDLDPLFHTPGWAEKRLKELRKEERVQAITLEQPTVDAAAMEVNALPDWYPQALKDWLSECGLDKSTPEDITFDMDMIEEDMAQDGSEGWFRKFKPGDFVKVTVRHGQGFGQVETSARFKVTEPAFVGWTRVEDEKIERD